MLAPAILVIFLDAMAWHLALACTLSLPRAQRRYPRHGRCMGRASGVVIGLFGLRMIVGGLADFHAPAHVP